MNGAISSSNCADMIHSLHTFQYKFRKKIVGGLDKCLTQTLKPAEYTLQIRGKPWGDSV